MAYSVRSLMAVSSMVFAAGTPSWAHPDAPAVRIEVGAVVGVSASRPGDTHYEVHAAADPDRPGHLVVGSIVYPVDDTDVHTVVYASRDGGRSWAPSLDGPALEHTGDPALAFGPDGSAYYTASSIPPDGGTRTMLFFRSRDGGASWTDSTSLTYTDRQYVTVDGGGGPDHGRIYVHGNNRVPRDVSDFVVFSSDDGGRSFRGPGTRSGFGDFTAESMGNAVVLSDGTFLGVFSETVDGRPVLSAVTSRNGGETLDPAVTVADFVPGGNRKGAHNNVNAQPMLAVDGTDGPYRDRLYVAWPDRRGGRSQILLSTSGDLGATWSPPRVVNDAPPSDTTDAFMPVVAVNAAGVLGVMWYDRRRHPDNLGWHVRFTASPDGGATFVPSVEISPVGSTFGPTTPWTALRAGVARGPGGLSLSVALNSFMFLGGDTAGLVADAAGVFHAVWVDNRTGIPQVWTAPVTVTQGAAGERAPERGAEPTGRGSPPAPSAGVPLAGAVAGDGAVPLAVAGARRPAGAGGADRAGTPPPSGRDVSGLVDVVVTRSSYERIGEVLSLTVRLVNRSPAALHGPFHVDAGPLESELGDPRALNADNGLNGIGARWSFPDAAVPPGGRSGERVLQFALEPVRPFRDGLRYRLGLLDVPLRVWQTP
jgi:hypothetical protein